MIVTEHPPVTMGGRTTYTVHIETAADAAMLRQMEAEGISIEQFASAFKHNEEGEPVAEKQKRASAKKATPRKKGGVKRLATSIAAGATKK